MKAVRNTRASCLGFDSSDLLMSTAPDYSIGFSRAELDEILATQKAELKRTLAAWSESGSSVQKRRIDEIHAIIAACQAALRKLAPEVYGRSARVAASEVTGYLPK